MFGLDDDDSGMCAVRDVFVAMNMIETKDVNDRVSICYYAIYEMKWNEMEWNENKIYSLHGVKCSHSSSNGNLREGGITLKSGSPT